MSLFFQAFDVRAAVSGNAQLRCADGRPSTRMMNRPRRWWVIIGFYWFLPKASCGWNHQ